MSQNRIHIGSLKKIESQNYSNSKFFRDIAKISWILYGFYLGHNQNFKDTIRIVGPLDRLLGLDVQPEIQILKVIYCSASLGAKLFQVWSKQY
jgi:hypothetical protein